MKNIIIAFLLGCVSIKMTGQDKLNTVKKNGMEVKWHHSKNSILFTLKAPTYGWITIGFNEYNSLKGTYLLMGRIRQNSAEVDEYFILSPGNYSPIKSLDNQTLIKEVSGFESNDEATISFEVEISSECKYQKDLSAGKSYWMILAYSREDDYQHHSLMRTSVQIKL